MISWRLNLKFLVEERHSPDKNNQIRKPKSDVQLTRAACTHVQLKKFLAFGVRLLNKHAPDTFTFPKRKSEKMNKNLFVKELKTVFHLDDVCLQKFMNNLVGIFRGLVSEFCSDIVRK